MHAYIYTQREARRPKNTPGAVRHNTHGVLLQDQTLGSNLLLQGKHLDMCIYKPKGAPALLWELGVQQYLFEERLLSQLRPVASGQ